jgi:hypothetical protein
MPLSMLEHVQLFLSSPIAIFSAVFLGVMASGIFLVVWDNRRDGWQSIPPGWPKISPTDWKKIEGAIGVELSEARMKFYALGKKAMLHKINDEIESRKGLRTPYEVLDIEIGSEHKLENRVTQLLSLYNPENFEYLDEAFVKLATIRTKEIMEAAGRIRSIRTAKLQSKSISGGNF